MRSEFADTATPIFPYGPFGSPCSSKCFQVDPPSVDRYSPLPGPPLSMLHDVRRACHSAPKIMLGLCGSNDTSMPPVFSSLYRTFSHVFPPSSVRKIPRSGFGPYGCPNAATNAISGFVGLMITLPIARESLSPTFFHVFPPSSDLYTPSPWEILPRMQASPVPTYSTL